MEELILAAIIGWVINKQLDKKAGSVTPPPPSAGSVTPPPPAGSVTPPPPGWIPPPGWTPPPGTPASSFFKPPRV